ncbi:hypothetical protein RUND412_006457 [Rhizina undulata]
MEPLNAVGSSISTKPWFTNFQHERVQLQCAGDFFHNTPTFYVLGFDDKLWLKQRVRVAPGTKRIIMECLVKTVPTLFNPAFGGMKAEEADTSRGREGDYASTGHSGIPAATFGVEEISTGPGGDSQTRSGAAEYTPPFEHESEAESSKIEAAADPRVEGNPIGFNFWKKRKIYPRRHSLDSMWGLKTSIPARLPLRNPRQQFSNTNRRLNTLHLPTTVSTHSNLRLAKSRQ